MSQVQAVGTPDVRQSIARASQATGVDFDYLLAQAKLESNLRPDARAGTSSAAGLYQFLGNTWLDVLDRHGADYGYGWAEAAIGDGTNGRKTVDPAMSGQIMALRYDPDASSLMAAELARDNRDQLQTALGREPDFAELYLAHFLGGDGASRFLTSLQQTPGASAASLFPKAAAANRAIFFADGGRARSLDEVMTLFRDKMERATEAGGAYPGAQFAPAVSGTAGFAQDMRPMGPLAREFHGAAQDHAPHRQISMVETLRTTFGAGDGPSAALPDNVRAAYSKLKAFGL